MRALVIRAALVSFLALTLGCMDLNDPAACTENSVFCPDGGGDDSTADTTSVDSGRDSTPTPDTDDTSVGDSSSLDSGKSDSGADADSALADGCVPSTSCPAGHICGPYPDGCGGTISCGSCESSHSCTAANTCACATGTKECGGSCVAPDPAHGCADSTRCTACAATETCVGSPSVCQCVPETFAATCSKVECGSATNNCGTSVDCGTSACKAPTTCGAGGVANKCGCAGTTPCDMVSCGTIKDLCGVSYSCGCTTPSTCGGGGTAGKCGTCVGLCGGPTCRYTVIDPGTGVGGGACPGTGCDGSGLVKDNVSGLTWTRYHYNWGTGPTADAFCSGKSMRLPTQTELQVIGAGTSSYDSCAFPIPWTSTSSTPGTYRNVVMKSDGTQICTGSISFNTCYYVLCVKP